VRPSCGPASMSAPPAVHGGADPRPGAARLGGPRRLAGSRISGPMILPGFDGVARSGRASACRGPLLCSWRSRAARLMPSFCPAKRSHPAGWFAAPRGRRTARRQVRSNPLTGPVGARPCRKSCPNVPAGRRARTAARRPLWVNVGANCSRTSPPPPLPLINGNAATCPRTTPSSASP
jgi:hypothetical protein